MTLFFAIMSNAIALFMFWLFLSAGMSKLKPSNRHYYVGVFGQYGVTLPELVNASVWIIGSLEVVSGILILVPEFRMAGAALCAIMLAVYWCLFANQIRQGKVDIDCGCAGPGGGVMVSPALLIRNALLMALLGLLTFSNETLTTSVRIDYWLLSAVMAAMIVLISLSAEHLIANAQKLKRLIQTY